MKFLSKRKAGARQLLRFLIRSLDAENGQAQSRGMIDAKQLSFTRDMSLWAAVTALERQASFAPYEEE